MSEHPLRLLLAQCNLVVGDVDGNATRVLEAARAATAAGADLALLLELALAGYPPEDLLFHSGFRRQVRAALERLRREAGPVDLVFGYPEYADGAIYNSAALIRASAIDANYRKQVLPNYRVFDEKRYFVAGRTPTLVEVNGTRLALLVCEDIWEPAPAARRARAAGAEALLVINASSLSAAQATRARAGRAGARRRRGTATGLPQPGRRPGRARVRWQQFRAVCRWRPDAAAARLAGAERHRPSSSAPGGRLQPVPAAIAAELSEEASVYQALVLGVRDYVSKHGFPGVVMGLSGGVDSALTLAIAVDALGPARVQAVMMPSRYTAAISCEDAEAQARAQGVRYSSISIEGMFEATLAALAGEFAGRPADTAEENIQSRCRGVLLMGISNKTGSMLLTTGNKSEMSVGYATLYGDMAGGFAPIKDCSKLMVYRLAKYRNALSPVIPARVIERPPTAELRADQKDTDSLPPYEVMDPILEAFIEEDLSVDEIASRGFDRATVGRILELVKRNEYKRRQAPPGIRISGRAFGRDWRYPITSGYRTR